MLIRRSSALAVIATDAARLRRGNGAVQQLSKFDNHHVNTVNSSFVHVIYFVSTVTTLVQLLAAVTNNSDISGMI